MKSFFKQQQAIKKGQQVTHVLNASSDAIIAFGKEQNGNQELDFIFCNSKSITLFGCDFMQDTL